MRNWKWILSTAGVSLGVASSAAAFWGTMDFGLFRDYQMEAHSIRLFGIVRGLESSSFESISADEADANPRALAGVARGLHTRVVSAHADLAPNIDMMALWPNDRRPTHLIACNEQGTGQPGLQRIELATGDVETIWTGTKSCDPVHRTAWGTVLVGEEAGSTGQLIELFNPLETTGVSYDRETGIATGGVGANNVVQRLAAGRTSYEGVGVLPNGILYYGDENRPSEGTAGGAYYKFVPSNPYMGGAPITDPDDSPLADGQVYGLRLGVRHGGTDYGQGTQTGRGTWIEIADSYDANLRSRAAELKLTGYYRPEDLGLDQVALAEGNVRFCGNNTGNEEDDMSFGETICVTDGTLDEALANSATPEVQYLVIGNPQLAMMDNIAYQPGTGNWVLHEDGDSPGVYGRNNDLWSCLDDGDDDDLLSDGCVRIATLNDLHAEWTGGLFDASGKRFFVSVQHNVTGHGVILELRGWR